MQTTPRRILLDLDDVLADFTTGVCQLWKIARGDLEYAQPAGTWIILPGLSKCIGREVTLTEFWQVINQAGAKFWADLEPLPWAKDLVDRCRLTVGNDWHVVSSPSHCPTSYDGKVQWLKNYFGRSFSQFALTPHKQIFATPEVVLIDDRDDNIYQFRRYGGRGIVFPGHQNSLWEFKATPMKAVTMCLDAIFNKTSNA